MKNKYINRAHITEKKFREVLKFLAANAEVIKNKQVYKQNTFLEDRK